jgi:metal-dependent hydrolase (beta-lactamase superfamily II)
MFTAGALKTNINVTEQSIVLNIPNKGLVIVVGCSHPTLPAIVEKAMQVAKTIKSMALSAACTTYSQAMMKSQRL